MASAGDLDHHCGRLKCRCLSVKPLLRNSYSGMVLRIALSMTKGSPAKVGALFSARGGSCATSIPPMLTAAGSTQHADGFNSPVSDPWLSRVPRGWRLVAAAPIELERFGAVDGGEVATSTQRCPMAHWRCSLGLLVARVMIPECSVARSAHTLTLMPGDYSSLRLHPVYRPDCFPAARQVLGAGALTG